MTFSFLLTLHIFITLALIGVILLQKSDGGSALVGGSGPGTMFTARGASNLLTRATGVLATLFIGNCILMTVITSAQIREATSLLDTPASKPAAIATPASSTPAPKPSTSAASLAVKSNADVPAAKPSVPGK
ncbi:MAG: preprotein translocase subunit SecG [Alphaproteobacteria bacterium]|nr:preprotein translocase subunit SecG [Alphaproteobacteria bacterium]